MTTNKQIDELNIIERMKLGGGYSKEEIYAFVDSQQKRIQELESDLKQAREIVMQEAKLANEAEAKLSAIRLALCNFEVEICAPHNHPVVVGDYAGWKRPHDAILDTVKDAPCNCSVETRTVCDKCQRPVSPEMQTELDAAVMRGFEDAPVQQPYNKRKIAEELIATAQGDSYYGNALYVALDLAEGKDKEMLHRYLHGSELTSDKFALQEFANRLAQQPEQGE